MYRATRPLTLSALLASLLTPTGLYAADEHAHRQYAAHVHGIATLTLAAEDHEIQVMLSSPAANIVGFEHPTASESDRRAVAAAKAKLEDAQRLLVFPPAAGCRTVHSEIHSELFASGHAAHAHEAEHKHEGGPAQHADIVAEYHFECATPGKLERLQVRLFDFFPATEHLEVEYVIGDKQGAAELGHAHPVLTF